MLLYWSKIDVQENYSSAKKKSGYVRLEALKVPPSLHLVNWLRAASLLINDSRLEFAVLSSLK